MGCGGWLGSFFVALTAARVGVSAALARRASLRLCWTTLCRPDTARLDTRLQLAVEERRRLRCCVRAPCCCVGFFAVLLYSSPMSFLCRSERCPTFCSTCRETLRELKKLWSLGTKESFWRVERNVGHEAEQHAGTTRKAIGAIDRQLHRAFATSDLRVP